MSFRKYAVILISKLTLSECQLFSVHVSRLKREELGHQAYKLLVELAEETYGIQIRKNSEAK